MAAVATDDIRVFQQADLSFSHPLHAIGSPFLSIICLPLTLHLGVGSHGLFPLIFPSSDLNALTFHHRSKPSPSWAERLFSLTFLLKSVPSILLDDPDVNQCSAPSTLYCTTVTSGNSVAEGSKLVELPPQLAL